MSTRERFVADVEAARLIGIAPQTLLSCRCSGKGPPYPKLGGMVRHKAAQLFDHMDSGCVDRESREEVGT